MFKAAIRVNKMTTIAQLRGASLHAQRHDETGKARVREDAEPGFDLAAFKAHKAELGAGERKGSTASKPSVRTALRISTIWRSPLGTRPSLRCTRRIAAGNSQSLNGAPFRSAPGFRASTGT